MLPDPKSYCHRTGFKTLCRKLVSKGYCNRWRSIPFFNKSTGEQFERWDCVDNLAYQMEIEHAAQLDGMRSELNALRNQVAASHDASMVGAIANLNQKLNGQEQAARLAATPATKLIEQQ